MRGYHQNIPKFLVGHSLGALYAARLCQSRSDFFRGCILINPMFEMQMKLSAWKLATLKAKQFVQFKERQRFPEMDNIMPDEFKNLKESREDF